MEPEFWEVLREIADREHVSVAALIRRIDESLEYSSRQNLSSAIRVFILNYLQRQIKKIP